MTLKLDANVVYAILAAIVVIVLIVNITRIIFLSRPPRYHESTPEVDTWPKQQ